MIVEWAHQGGAKEAPSNTLRAMHRTITAAKGRAAVGLECDVHLTADNKLVVLHDKTLERTTNGRGRVRHQPYAAIEPPSTGIEYAHAGWWWRRGVVDDHDETKGPYPLRHDTSYGLRVPLLDDILALDRPGMLTIEIKSMDAAKALADRLKTHTSVPNKEIVVTSFSSLRLRTFRKAMGDNITRVQLSPGLGYMVWFKLRVAVGLAPNQTIYSRIQIPVRILKLAWATPRFVRAAEKVKVKHRPGETLQIDVWTVDDEPTMHGLLDLDVDGIMTDTPSLLRDVAAQHPLWL